MVVTDTKLMNALGVGVGLGLAVVQRIAHAFGGAVHVRSALGQGSYFTLELPEVREPREARMPVAAP